MIHLFRGSIVDHSLACQVYMNDGEMFSSHVKGDKHRLCYLNKRVGQVESNPRILPVVTQGDPSSTSSICDSRPFRC